MQQAITTHKTMQASTYKTFDVYARDKLLEYRLDAICAIESAAADLGYILLPARCLSWRKRAQLGDARRIKIHESFYAVWQHELTDLERNNFLDYLDKLGADKNDFASKQR